MTTGVDDPIFTQLTSLLHHKADTGTITVGELDGIFNKVCNTSGVSANKDRPVYDIVVEKADECDTSSDNTLENKVVLAIAIRLAAEKFMVGRICDPAFVAGIKANQTAALIKKFKELFPSEKECIATLDKVALMTPESIHLNSFMYEPIIDMSDDSLRRLYGKVKVLK